MSDPEMGEGEKDVLLNTLPRSDVEGSSSGGSSCCVPCTVLGTGDNATSKTWPVLKNSHPVES